jgi:Protein of unknown function (DUF1566)
MQPSRQQIGTVPLAAVIALWIGVFVPLAFAKKVPAPVAQTGQTTSFATGDDGDIEAGVPFPTPRFINKGDGTVEDQLTGLIWLRKADCSTISTADWPTAVSNANHLAHGQCGLVDGSVAGDWRLPNIKELQSLLDFGFADPVLSNAAGTAHWTEGDAFLGVRSSDYWSSTSDLSQPDSVFAVSLGNGRASPGASRQAFATNANVWPVRGGQ